MGAVDKDNSAMSFFGKKNTIKTFGNWFCMGGREVIGNEAKSS